MMETGPFDGNIVLAVGLAFAARLASSAIRDTTTTLVDTR
jgi:hypothetical protein